MSDSPDAAAESDDAEIDASSSSISQMDPQLKALLDFTPVPRKYKRANAWTPALQRRFILHLANSGSPAKAAAALGKDRFGIEKVYKSEGAESFRQAWAAAIALFEERDAARQEAAAAPWAGMRPPAGVDHRAPGPKPRTGSRGSPEDDANPCAPIGLEDADPKEQEALLDTLLHRYFIKLDAERKARLAGEVTAADFYLRQLTWMEAAFDAASGFRLLQLLRIKTDNGEGYKLIQIAETPASQLLDQARRLYWESIGEPPRPPRLAPEYLVEHRTRALGEDGEPATATFYSEPLESTRGGLPESHEEQRAAFQARYRRAAEEQVKWEAAAQAAWGAAEHSAEAQAAWGAAEHSAETLAPLPDAGEGSSRSEQGEGADEMGSGQ